jgi:hypothetical protein
MRRAPAQAPLPANCLKPKVFLGRRSIRQIRAPGKKFAAAHATASAEFACAKGQGAICLSFRQTDLVVRSVRRRAVQLTPKLFCG